jgi:broad specificity phosphatase PhoE
METTERNNNDSAHHMNDMQALYDSMRSRPFLIRAYALADPLAPLTSAACKIVHFVRHGQGFHNLLADLANERNIHFTPFTNQPENPYVNAAVLDAPLTELGRQQAEGLRERISQLPAQPQLIVSSPLCRALQTASLAFLHVQVPFVAHELVREEMGVHVCDQRRSVARHQVDFPHVDFDLIQNNEDVLFQHDTRERRHDVGDRAYQFLEWLHKRPEQHVAVTSHSAWLLTLFHGVVECMDESLKQWFETGEMRSVKLVFIKNCVDSERDALRFGSIRF